MQIQKGLVKYKDRTDIVCTYGLTDDGKQYYFLDGNTITNGNIIASTVLVEAIDPVVVASSVGVIDPNGDVVVPFENKSVKPISDMLLLVEKAVATTPSVVEANKLRSDPLAATKLVTTPATIKARMNAKMGGEGRFIFNDQFSEATVCDINGNNLVDDEYFSFIGIKNNDTLYLSKNTIDSPVSEFSLSNGMLVALTDDTAEGQPLDIQSTEVTKDTIDGAMAEKETISNNRGFGDGDITSKHFVNALLANDEDGTDSTEECTNSVVSVEENIDVVEQEDVVLETDQTVEETVPTEEVSVDAVSESTSGEEVQENSPEDVVLPVAEEQSEASETAEDKQDDVMNVVDDMVQETALVDSEIDSNLSEVESDLNEDLVAFDFGDNINYSDTVSNADTVEEEIEEISSEFKNEFFDDLDTDIFAESTLHVDTISDESYESSNYSNSSKDTIIEDVAATMSNLINLNRMQKQKIVGYEEKFEQLATTHKRIVEKARAQIKELDLFKAKMRNYENMINKLESKIQTLESKIHEQERIIASQTGELEALRPQIEGKNELVRILADAQSLLDQAA